LTPHSCTPDERRDVRAPSSQDVNPGCSLALDHTGVQPQLTPSPMPVKGTGCSTGSLHLIETFQTSFGSRHQSRVSRRHRRSSTPAPGPSLIQTCRRFRRSLPRTSSAR
jgi:hypothetical protein